MVGFFCFENFVFEMSDEELTFVNSVSFMTTNVELNCKAKRIVEKKKYLKITFWKESLQDLQVTFDLLV